MGNVSLTVNGVLHELELEPRELLVYVLRERLGLTGTTVGCDTSSCGACTVLLDGESVKSCNVLGVQADGHEITTIEGLATNGSLHPLQESFHDHHALQCGYCTSGMVLAAVSLLSENPQAERGRDQACDSRATSAAAPATRTSSDAIAAVAAMTRRRGRNRDVDRRLRRAQGGRKLLHGQAQWVDNMRLPGIGLPRVVRSPYAHARIRSVDVAPALAHADVDRGLVRRGSRRGLERRPAVRMAADRGHEGSAALPARDRQGALRRATASPSSSREPRRGRGRGRARRGRLRAVAGGRRRPEAALADGAPLVHEELRDERAATRGSSRRGDVDRLFADGGRRRHASATARTV